MVCAEEDFRDDLLPQGYALVGLDESIRRSLVEPSEDIARDPAAADPMGPLPQDPAWASGGEDLTLVERAVGVARGAASVATGLLRP